MSAVSLWFFSYGLHFAGGLVMVFVLRNVLSRGLGIMSEVLILHTALLTSIAVSHYLLFNLGYSFPWSGSVWSFSLLAFSVLFSVWSIKKLGLFYIFSSFVQELVLLSAAFLLLHEISLFLVILSIVPVFAVSHLIRFERWKIRLSVTLLWGIATIILFFYLRDIYLNTALHIIFGSFLASRNILYMAKKPEVKV